MKPARSIEDLAIELANESERISSALRLYGHRQKRLHTALRAVNGIVSVSVVVLVAVPDLTQFVGPEFIRIAAGVAATVLLFDTLLPLFSDFANYEQIFGYSRYLHRYKGIVKETIANEKYSAPVRHGRLLETIRLIQENISDAKTNWPIRVEPSKDLLEPHTKGENEDHLESAI